MNQREANQRALALCSWVLKHNIENGTLVNSVDDDTEDEDAERIVEAAEAIQSRLQERADKLARRGKPAPTR